MEINEINELIVSCLKQTLIEREEAEQVGDDLNHFTELLGKQAVLDSVGLVSLIINIEQNLCDNHGVDAILADERAMSQKSSPFLTVGTLSQYIYDSYFK